MTVVQDDLTFALVTPSYAPDFERCKLLAESVERCLVDGTKHYIIVDREDVPLFKQLSSSKIKLLVVEELLPFWIFRVPGFKQGWMSLCTLPIRNWVLQQLVKMSVFDAISEDIVVFCDSDNTFIRPFDLKSRLLKNGNLALLRVGFHNQETHQWLTVSQQLLGIADRQIPDVSYISNMIAWRRNNILEMRRQIEETSGKHWIRAVCQHWSISEYMIYGVFVEHVLGIEAARHFPFDDELIKPNWDAPLQSEAAINDFFSTIKDEHIGVMIHSKFNTPIELYRDKVKACWKQTCSSV